MKITVIGTGYVGLTNILGLADFGHQITCLDIKKLLKKNYTLKLYKPEALKDSAALLTLTEWGCLATQDNN